MLFRSFHDVFVTPDRYKNLVDMVYVAPEPAAAAVLAVAAAVALARRQGVAAEIAFSPPRSQAGARIAPDFFPSPFFRLVTSDSPCPKCPLSRETEKGSEVLCLDPRFSSHSERREESRLAKCARYINASSGPRDPSLRSG